jgi:hypothetical protein
VTEGQHQEDIARWGSETEAAGKAMATTSGDPRPISLRERAFLSGIFGEAIRAGLRKDDQNPVASVKIRGVRDKRKPNANVRQSSLIQHRRKNSVRT